MSIYIYIHITYSYIYIYWVFAGVSARWWFDSFLLLSGCDEIGSKAGRPHFWISAGNLVAVSFRRCVSAYWPPARQMWHTAQLRRSFLTSRQEKGSCVAFNFSGSVHQHHLGGFTKKCHARNLGRRSAKKRLLGCHGIMPVSLAPICTKTPAACLTVGGNLVDFLSPLWEMSFMTAGPHRLVESHGRPGLA